MMHGLLKNERIEGGFHAGFLSFFVLSLDEIDLNNGIALGPFGVDTHPHRRDRFRSKYLDKIKLPRRT